MEQPNPAMSNRSFLKGLQYRFEASAAYALYGLFRVLPVSWASAFGGQIIRWFGPLSRPHQTTASNLAHAFPDLSSEALAKIQSEVWDNLGRVSAEYAALSRLWGPEEAGRIEVSGAEHIVELARRGSPAIIFSGHIANWETLPITIARMTKPPAIVYRAPNNPYVDRLLQSSRRASCKVQIPKGHGGARDIMREIKAGGFVAMLIDQKSNTGLPVPLFGRDAMTGDAVARIAMRFKCPIVPAQIERRNGCRFKVTFEEPWQTDSMENDEAAIRDLLKRMNEKLETWVRQHPGQWLWVHNRWPKDSPAS